MGHAALQLPNFRWLWLGQFILCASQFWFVALTWLLMAAAIPRGFMLIGRAISDRLRLNSLQQILNNILPFLSQIANELRLATPAIPVTGIV